MVFIDNKYTKCYYKIIANAKSRASTGEDYIEIHHIVPKSMGGNNDKNNLAKLTAREHFVCHLLLTKMTYGKYKRNMHFAFWALSNKMKHTNNPDAYDFVVNSRFYELAKENFSTEMSILHKGKILSQETKDKLSFAHTGKKLSEEHKARINPVGRILSAETKEKISKGQIGRIGGMQNKTHSEETKLKISESNMGIKKPSMTEGRKLQISAQFIGTTQSQEHISKRISSRKENGYYKNEDETRIKMSMSAKNRTKLKCKCGKECSPSNYKRWHGNNCKLMHN